MEFYTVAELKDKGFLKVGKKILIRKNVNFYNINGSIIGSNCRIDDHSILVGKIIISNNVHIAAYSIISASTYGNRIKIGKYTGIGPKCYISCSSEDYLANDISNPTINKKFRKNIIFANITLGKNILIGANSTIMPGKKNRDIIIGNNVSIGYQSLILKSIKPNNLTYNPNNYKNISLTIKEKINYKKIKLNR